MVEITPLQERHRFREIWLTEDVDATIYQTVLAPMAAMVDSNPALPIKLYIASYGGSIHEALAVYNFVKGLSTNIYTIALSQVMSAAFVIFMAGDVRQAYRNSVFLVHAMTLLQTDELLPNSYVQTNTSMRLMERLAAEWSKTTKVSSKQWMRWLADPGTDYYLFAEEALKRGIVHEVL